LALKGNELIKKIKASRDYRNPNFLEKMAAAHGLDLKGTCFSPDIWDPHSLPACDFYERYACELSTYSCPWLLFVACILGC
jgi:hypothetical protein